MATLRYIDYVNAVITGTGSHMLGMEMASFVISETSCKDKTIHLTCKIYCLNLSNHNVIGIRICVTELLYFFLGSTEYYKCLFLPSAFPPVTNIGRKNEDGLFSSARSRCFNNGDVNRKGTARLSCHVSSPWHGEVY